MHKQALTAGSILAMLAVVLGAFGAHALKDRLEPRMLAAFETGNRYHFYHCFALLITGILFYTFPVKQLKQASTFFIIGISLFSGSLYAMALLSLADISLGRFAILTPIGGVFFILGWLFLFLGVVNKK